MSEDRVVELRHPGSFSEDPLTSVLRSGARRLLAQAVEMEVTAFIAAHGDLEDDAGRRRVVRHGHHRERQVQTGIGPVAVRCPRVRDRGGSGEAGKIRFTSAILPPYLRRAKSIEELLPWLYLKGISTGDFTEALAALLGPDAPGLSASTITRLKDVWQGELARWEKRDLSARRYLYFWADGIYFQPRMEHDKQCILVIIGADQSVAATQVSANEYARTRTCKYSHRSYRAPRKMPSRALNWVESWRRDNGIRGNRLWARWGFSTSRSGMLVWTPRTTRW